MRQPYPCSTGYIGSLMSVSLRDGCADTSLEGRSDGQESKLSSFPALFRPCSDVAAWQDLVSFCGVHLMAATDEGIHPQIGRLDRHFLCH
jgi:hypothetical protein